MNVRRMLAIVCCFCAGCGSADPAASGEHALEGSVAEAPVGPGPHSHGPDVRDEVVLDQRADGARLFGQIEPVPPNSDADRVIALRVVGPAASLPGLEGARVTDARFVGDDVVTIGADYVLRVHFAGGEVVALDSEVFAPLSVAGTQLAYARGDAPFFEISRADVRTGAVQSVSEGMAPAWSPALTPDGRAIVFVSAIEGSPRLYRAEGSGEPRALAPTARTPSSPIAPRFVTEPGEGELLVFEDEAGRVWLEPEQGRVVRTAEVAR